MVARRRTRGCVLFAPSESLAAAVLALLLCLAPSQVSAQTDPPVTLTLRGDETPETVRKLVDTLSVGGRKVEVRLLAPDAAAPGAATTPPAAAAVIPPAADSRIEQLWDHFVDGFDQGNAAVPNVVDLPSDWKRSWAANRNGATGLSAGWRILAGVLVAVAGALLFRFATAGWFARRLRPSGPEFTARLVSSAYGLVQDLACIALALTLANLARILWLSDPDLAMTTFRTAANGAAIGAVYIAAGRFLVAPGASERRVLPLPRAERHFSILTAYAIATPIIVTSTLLIQDVATSRQALAGLVAISSLAITLFKVWWFFDARRDLTALVLRYEAVPGAGLRLVAAITPWFYIASAIAIWMVGRASTMMAGGGRFVEAAGLTQIIIVLAPISAVGVTSLIACRQVRLAAVMPRSPMAQAAGAAFRAAAGGLIWVAGLYVISRLWAGFLLGVSSAQFAEVSRQAASLAILVFLGWVAIVFLRAFFDAYTPRGASGPLDEDAAIEESVPSRLATVMPVLRGVVLGAVFGLTALVVLSRIGVDIGPLLAAFSILGLAISFGSQALVRDIVSGFFFMLEDAFRVGEYVDTGKLKGTVEKISLRSMQMRHQSGQIHTVPFGQIQSLTNASRDWATIKFNVRLDHAADIEQARKTIKKVGLALLEDPEFGPHFIAQLKMQGVADITDSAVVIRLKFTAKPAHASTLQREALKRVYRALNEAHVPFASNAVTVRGGEGSAYSAAGAASIATAPLPSPQPPAVV